LLGADDIALLLGEKASQLAQFGLAPAPTPHDGSVPVPAPPPRTRAIWLWKG